MTDPTGATGAWVTSVGAAASMTYGNALETNMTRDLLNRGLMGRA